MSELTANQKRWQSIIEDWKQSGLTQAEYCRQHRIKVSHFYFWKNQLKKKMKHRQPESQGVFLPVVLESAPSDTVSLLRIRVGGVEIDVSHQTDPVLLQKTVQWLGGLS